MHGHVSMRSFLFHLIILQMLNMKWPQLGVMFFLGYLGKPHWDTDLIWATRYPPRLPRKTHRTSPMCVWNMCVDGQLCQMDMQACSSAWSAGGKSQWKHWPDSCLCVPDTPRFPSLRMEKETIWASGACALYHHIDCSDGTGFCRGWDDVTELQRPPLATSTFLKVGFECEFYQNKSQNVPQCTHKALLKCESLFPCQLPATVKCAPWSSRLIRVQKEILQSCHPVLLSQAKMNLEIFSLKKNKKEI